MIQGPPDPHLGHQLSPSQEATQPPVSCPRWNPADPAQSVPSISVPQVNSAAEKTEPSQGDSAETSSWGPCRRLTGRNSTGDLGIASSVAHCEGGEWFVRSTGLGSKRPLISSIKASASSPVKWDTYLPHGVVVRTRLDNVFKGTRTVSGP